MIDAARWARRNELGKTNFGWRKKLVLAGALANYYMPKFSLPGRNPDSYISQKDKLNTEMPAVTRQYARKRTPSATVSSRARRMLWPTSTPSSKNAGSMRLMRKQIKNIGAMHSKSAGFLKVKAKSRRRRRRKATLERGALINVEHGGLLTDPYCVYVGHSSMPTNTVFESVVRSLIKSLFLRAGTRVPSWDSGPGYNGNIVIDYYAAANTATISQLTVAFTNSQAYNTILGNVFTSLTSLTENAELMSMSIVSVDADAVQRNPIVSINLRNSQVTVKVKSSFKIQNRSKNALGSEADDVDNVPLYGKSYEGKGTSIRNRDRNRGTSAAFTGHVTHGTVEIGAASLDPATTNWKIYQEPPEPGAFENCRKYGKVKLDPGEIKTSVITSYKRMSPTGWLRLFLEQGTSGSYRRYYIGSTKLFALEKMLETANVTPTDVVVAYEHNLNIQVACYTKKDSYTTQVCKIEA